MIRTSIRRPIAVSMVFLTVAALGVLAYRNVPLELLPDTSMPRLTVAASWPGASPEIVEAFLTAPLEGVIQQIRGVERITSTSTGGSAVPGRTSINVEFARETDMDFARLELAERMASLEESMPAGVSAPTVTPYVPTAFQDQNRPVLRYTMTGPFTLEYLRQYVDDVIEPELSQAGPVGRFEASGGRRRVLLIELDEHKILSLGLSISQVSSSIRGLHLVREAGLVDAPGGIQRTLAIRERVESLAEVRQTPLLVDRGRVVRVLDVARVSDTLEEPQSHYRINGNPAVSFSIYKRPLTNTVKMADAVKAHLATIEPAFPLGVRAILNSDQSVDINRQLKDLGRRAAIAAVIVLLVLLLFLQSWRASIIVFATVAFSVLITINLMYFLGFTLNLLTLMGLAMGFGLVVDNAIVVLENIYRRRRRGESAEAAAEHGAAEVVLPILAATGTTLVVLIPFVYLQGELRIYYVPLALVVGISLLASLFVAFTFIPALGAKLLGRVPVRADLETFDATATDAAGRQLLPPLAATGWPVRLYGGLIRGTLRTPITTVVLVLLLLGGSYHLFSKYVSRSNFGGLGGVPRSEVRVSIRPPRGEELARTDEIARFFEDRLKVMPEVDEFVTNVSPEFASIVITFPEAYEYTDIPLAVKDQMFQYSLDWGGPEIRVTGIGPSFYGGGGGAPNYSIRIFGYNFEKVREIAEDLAVRLKAQSSRIRDVDPNASGGYTRDKETEIVVELDRTRLAMHDLTAREFVQQVTASVRGRPDNVTLAVGGEELLFSIKLAGFDVQDMHSLQEIMIPAPSGEQVRLGNVATVREREVMATIRRENQQYERTLAYEFRGPVKLGDVVRDAVVETTALPPGYTIETQRQYALRPDERRQINGVLAIAILLVFMVTAALFESLRQPLCVLLTVPMALIGVFLIFFYVGANFTREAYVGVIMMGGIVVNNAILLVDHVNQLRRRHGLPLAEALERGALERVRPIMMTSLTTICGLLPLVLFSATANSNIWNALAYTLIGGLSSSTILVLTVTPALYLIFERGAEQKRVARAAEATTAPGTAAAPA